MCSFISLEARSYKLIDVLKKTYSFIIGLFHLSGDYGIFIRFPSVHRGIYIIIIVILCFYLHNDDYYFHYFILKELFELSAVSKHRCS